MHARVITLHIRPDKLDEASRMLSQASQSVGLVPGLHGMWTLVDRARCKRVVIEIWETEDDMRASERDGIWQRGFAAAGLLTSTPTRETYEIEGQLTF